MAEIVSIVFKIFRISQDFFKWKRYSCPRIDNYIICSMEIEEHRLT